MAFLLTLILNIFLLFSYSSVFGDRIEEPRLFMIKGITKEETMYYFMIVGIMMTCCSMFVVVFFLMKNLPLIIQKVIYLYNI